MTSDGITREEMETEFVALAEEQAKRVPSFPGIVLRLVPPPKLDERGFPIKDLDELKRECGCKARRGKIVLCHCLSDRKSDPGPDVGE